MKLMDYSEFNPEIQIVGKFESPDGKFQGTFEVCGTNLLNMVKQIKKERNRMNKSYNIVVTRYCVDYIKEGTQIREVSDTSYSNNVNSEYMLGVAMVLNTLLAQVK